ncbi:transketolase, partial [Escherichia coli]|nr:transketolase [Escherichia coli]
WNHPAVEIPGELGEAWLAAGKRGAAPLAAGKARLEAREERAEFERRMRGELPAWFSMQDHIQGLIDAPQKVATRKASEMALEAINAQ